MLHAFVCLEAALVLAFFSHLLLFRTVTPAFPGAVGRGDAVEVTKPCAGGMGVNSECAWLLASVNGPVVPVAETVRAVRTYGWEDVQSAEYPEYLVRLRGVGCTEDRVRGIVIEDVNRFFDGRLREIAIAHDSRYWEVRPAVTTTAQLHDIGLKVDEDREALLARLLGPGFEWTGRRGVLWREVQLTGPELGGLSREVHQRVQEICVRAAERHQAFYRRQFGAEEGFNEVESARLREQTRAELREVLSPEQYDAFLVRYSHNSELLRNELRWFGPTREEFDRIFFELDLLEQQMQLDYGSTDALSVKQLDRWRRQRQEAIRSVLTAERYQTYATLLAGTR